jgi:hypothetical protein
MSQLPTNICQLRGNLCIADRCAWWDYAASQCALVSIADNLSDIADKLDGEADGR